MIREMTLGQYYKANSILHKLDSEGKTFRNIAFCYYIIFSEKFIKSWDCDSISYFDSKAF